MSKRALYALLVIVVAFGFGPTGCSDDDEDSDGNGGITGPVTADVELTCIGCHTSEDALKATVEEEEETGGESAGEG